MFVLQRVYSYQGYIIHCVHSYFPKCNTHTQICTALEWNVTQHVGALGLRPHICWFSTFETGTADLAFKRSETQRCIVFCPLKEKLNRKWGGGLIQDPLIQDPLIQDPLTQDPVIKDPIIRIQLTGSSHLVSSHSGCSRSGSSHSGSSHSGSEGLHQPPAVGSACVKRSECKEAEATSHIQVVQTWTICCLLPSSPLFLCFFSKGRQSMAGPLAANGSGAAISLRLAADISGR